MAASGSILGNPVLRKEDPGLLTGANKYTGDMSPDGTAHIVFVRSPIAHGTLNSVDKGDAASMPGVLGVYTAPDLGLPAVPGMPGVLPDEISRPPLAEGKVRFVGDIIAAVVAETPGQAVDAAEQVYGEIDPLPVVTSAAAAMADGAPLLFEAIGGNVIVPTEFGDEGATDGADVVVEETIISQRLAGVPMEPNACLMIPDEPAGGMTAYISHQAPHAVHEGMAPALGLEPAQLRVVAPWVGGGFGPKAAFYVEYLLAAVIARQIGRPVKWTETRSENMLSMVHGRDFVMDTKLGVNNDGTIVGLEASVTADIGAYPTIGAVLHTLTQMMSQGVYNIPKIRFSGVSVATNTTAVGAYRGAGRPEATQMLERIVNIAAQKIGMDPAEIRRKNYLTEFPYSTPTGANYDSADHEAALDKALEVSGYAQLREEQAARRASNDPKLLGIGLSSYVEVTAPLELWKEYGSLTIEDDGTATMRVGTSAHGQGHDTAFSMIVSDMLGIDMNDVKHIQSDTAEVPRGAGTMGSRSLQTAGSAIHVASETVLAKAKELAAHMLEASADDIVVGEGGVLHVAGVPANSLSWAELAVAANDDAKRPSGMDAGLSHELDFDEGDATFPFGSHVAVVEVDRETGNVELVRHIAVDDCGTILNPMLVHGQQHGGIAQGAAQALYEWVQYDADGNPRTANLMDYAMPSAAELPSFEATNTETASPRNPLGAKGIGESGTIGSTPAVQNAVVDAVAHLGITHIDMPATPERVWTAISNA